MKSLRTVFVLAFLFLIYKIGAYPLIDADEPRYAEAAKEMMDANQYLIPLAEGLPRFDKPILFYWLEILSFKIFGISEWAARLPSVIAGALTVTLVYWLGSFYRCGIAAALALVTSFEFFIIAKMSITDATLNLFIVAVLILYYLIKERHVNQRYIYLLAFCAACGFLTKGPIAIVIPAMVVILDTLLAVWRKDSNPYMKLDLKHCLFAFGLFVLVAAPWYIAIHNATLGDFTQYFFIGQNIGRYSSVLSGHQQPWWFYIAVMIIGFMPWSLFLPALIADFKFKADALRLQSFALIWLFSVLGFFSFSSTKLANYVMSIFVPMAIIFAIWFREVPKKKWLVINASVYIILFTVLLYLYYQGYWETICAKEAFLQNYVHDYLILTLLWIFLGVFIGILLNIVFVNEYWSMRRFAILAIGLCIFAVDFFLMPFANYKEAGIKNFVQSIPDDVRIHLLRIERPSVSFYLKNKLYPQIVGMKKIRRKVAKGKRICMIAKHDKAEKINSVEGLHIWSKDDIYIFACSFPKKEPAEIAGS